MPNNLQQRQNFRHHKNVYKRPVYMRPRPQHITNKEKSSNLKRKNFQIRNSSKCRLTENKTYRRRELVETTVETGNFQSMDA